MASAHDNLMFQDEQRVSAAELEALQWLNDAASAEAVILAAPTPPFAVPMFTGRALLRTEYWLSPGDAVQAQVSAAWTSDRAAQQEVLPRADYVVLDYGWESAWQLDSYERVFDNKGSVIYRNRKRD